MVNDHGQSVKSRFIWLSTSSLDRPFQQYNLVNSFAKILSFFLSIFCFCYSHIQRKYLKGFKQAHVVKHKMNYSWIIYHVVFEIHYNTLKCFCLYNRLRSRGHVSAREKNSERFHRMTRFGQWYFYFYLLLYLFDTFRPAIILLLFLFCLFLVLLFFISSWYFFSQKKLE